jgi:hypothetical protein
LQTLSAPSRPPCSKRTHFLDSSCDQISGGKQGRSRSSRILPDLVGSKRPNEHTGRVSTSGRLPNSRLSPAVVPDVRVQSGAAPASCARLQSRQFPANAGDAGADQRLVADEPAGEIDQDRRESRKPWLLCRLPDGRSRYPTTNVSGDFATHRGTAAAAATSASLRCSTITHSRANEGRTTSECQRKWPDQTLEHYSDGLECREPSTHRISTSGQFRKRLPFGPVRGFIRGIPAKA